MSKITDDAVEDALAECDFDYGKYSGVPLVRWIYGDKWQMFFWLKKRGVDVQLKNTDFVQELNRAVQRVIDIDERIREG